MPIIPEQFASGRVCEYPPPTGPPDSVTEYAPASRVIVTPVSEPSNPVLLTSVPVMSIVQSAASASPPSRFTTFLIIVNSGASSSTVIVQVLESPAFIVMLVQSPTFEVSVKAVGPAVRVTEYVSPALIVIGVPEGAPENGLVMPVTSIVKSSATAGPVGSWSLITVTSTVSVPVAGAQRSFIVPPVIGLLGYCTVQVLPV